MAGRKLTAPLAPLTRERPIPLPERSRTPEALAVEPLPVNLRSTRSYFLVSLLIKLAGEGAFLVNSVIGHSSNCRICVGFQYDYERGTLGTRNGWTDRNSLETTIRPAFDLHLGPSICVTRTDTHSAAKIRKQVPVSHLRPERPNSKNQEVLVLKE